MRDLASPAAGFLEPWLPRDPTLELLKLADSWQPARQPQLLYDVWFDRRRAGGAARRRDAGCRVRPAGAAEGGRCAATAFERVAHRPGASARGERSRRFLRADAGAHAARGAVDRQLRHASGIVILLLVAYRSLPVLVLGLLPLVSAAVAGLAAVGTIFGAVHGITLALRLHADRRRAGLSDPPVQPPAPRLDARASARALWPTLATGVASTCVAYLAFLFSGVRGLAQLSVFTVVGLAVAGLTTRFLLPPLVPDGTRDAGGFRAAGTALERDRRPASTALAGRRDRGRLRRLTSRCRRDRCGRTISAALTPVPRAAARTRLGSCARSSVRPTSGTCSSSKARTRSPCWRRRRPSTRSWSRWSTRGQLGRRSTTPARYLPTQATQERRRAALPDPPSCARR